VHQNEQAGDRQERPQEGERGVHRVTERDDTDRSRDYTRGEAVEDDLREVDDEPVHDFCSPALPAAPPLGSFGIWPFSGVTTPG